MDIDYNNEKPIFIQIAEGIEDAVITGAFSEGSQIPSITEFSVQYKINPATALKGINLLVDEEVIYKKRGVGMFVSDGALSKLKAKRREGFYESYVKTMLAEAKRLGFTKDEVILMFEKEEEK